MKEYVPPLEQSPWKGRLLVSDTVKEHASKGIRLVRLDSLIIDVSVVFEAFLRRELGENLKMRGYDVANGNEKACDFFRESDEFTVHPDIIVSREGQVIGLLDAKYKPRPNERDRYELLAFMDAMGVSVGGFVCPRSDAEGSRFLGTTGSGKQMYLLRFDLAASDSGIELERLSENIERMLEGVHDLL